MASEQARVGTVRPPAAPGRPPTRRQRVESFVMFVPFWMKLGLVWVGIIIVLAIAFAAVGFDTDWMLEHMWFIAKGSWVVLFVAAISILAAIVLALLGALGRLSKNPIAYGVSGFYTSFFRGTPLIVQLFLIYLGLAQAAQALRQPYSDWFVLSAITAGIVGLSLNYGAYMTEIFRAGIQSVSHGQYEAADALGMTYRQKMRRIVLPQALRVVIPPVGNEFIAMMKDVALIALLGQDVFWSDPFRRANIVGTQDFRNLEAYVVAAGMFWLLTAIFTFFQRRLETKVGKGYIRTVDARTRWLGGGGGTRGLGRASVGLSARDDPSSPIDQVVQTQDHE
jgi:polar amino acid transport system permease protein